MKNGRLSTNMLCDKSVLESLEKYFSDMRIRQMLTPEKASFPLSKGIFYVLGYETRAEPGFLCCLPGKRVTWVSGRLERSISLRLRISPQLFERGTILIATLDEQKKRLRLEDVWLWEGDNIRARPYSERYKKLKPFWDEYFIQDGVMSGLEVTLARPVALEHLKEKVESSLYQGIDLIPEQGERRRFFLPLNKKKTPRVQDGHPSWCYARKVIGMPDTYDLFLGEKEVDSLGRAAVQSFALSQTLREAFQKQKVVSVEISWHSEFLCYEILNLYQNGQR
jgi:hypothetical protein